MRSVIFLAPPLSGKGTFSDYLVENYGYKQISTGDILRKRMASDEKLAAIMASGALVDDETIMDIVSDELKKISNEPFILDGIPRTLNQAKKLDEMLNKLNIKDILPIYIDVTKDNLIKRVTGRRVCPKCGKSYNIYSESFKPQEDSICDNCKIELTTRKDDNLESFLNRYEVFNSSTIKAIEYYKEKESLLVLDNNKEDQTEAIKVLEGAIHEH